MNSKSTTRSYHYQLLVVVSLIGAGLRLWQIDRWSLWQDEVLTVLSSQLLAFDYLPINPIPYLAVKSSIAISGLGAFGTSACASVARRGYQRRRKVCRRTRAAHAHQA